MISFSGDATDAEDGTLPASAYTWNIDFLHEGHVHPGTPITGVKSGTFTIPTSGHDFSGNTRYRITLTVTDSTGLTDTQVGDRLPGRRSTSRSTPPDGPDPLPRRDRQDDAVRLRHAGRLHPHDRGAQPDLRRLYTFGSWSDGGAQSHTIVVPATDQSYSATFQASAAPPAIAAWAFNEGSGTTAADASGNGLTGALTNGAPGAPAATPALSCWTVSTTTSSSATRRGCSSPAA